MNKIMNSNKVIISKQRLIELRACEESLNYFQNVIGLCPRCEKAILCEGFVCPHCGYDYSAN